MPRYRLYPITSGQPYRVNGGAMAHVGILASTTLFNKMVRGAKSLLSLYGSRMEPLSVQLANGNNLFIHVRAPKANQPLGQQRAGEYVGIKLSTRLAGLSNVILAGGASVSIKGRRAVHSRTDRRTLRSISMGWNRATGAYLNTPAVVLEYFGNNSAIPGRDDAAANPSTSTSFGLSRIPGEFAYLTSSKVPTTTSYLRHGLD